MTSPRIGVIVEGHGEVKAVPVLLTRLVSELLPNPWPTFLRPFRESRDALVAVGGIERAVDDLLSRHQALTGLLALIDGDDDCPATLGPELLTRIEAHRPGLRAAVVLAHREYEAWFLAAAPSLSGHGGLNDDLHVPPEPEGVRGCKEWLSKHRPRHLPYDPVDHQAGLSATFDLAMARKNSPSFDKFWRDVEFLITGKR
ncbi:DUF4276 family protein [Nonomuraea turkmeniaca]|uniref:DUF4276 family protein n=1 Tax=Nonomuraea turkmeniaca TaxID=103838 RepID=A0A5S4F1H2_9ACTN|nr:DUF4276 family protein [Nonomuraea turkmeniaca]TMR09928.1 DUF4276 family protein [Nonomuraea turkmeniaca]